MVHTVAVIGAGPSGLTSIKACLDEGMVPTCFESSDDMGGLWKFKEVSEPNRASIYRSLTINIWKEMMCYSDFPIPADYPNYMHHSKILKYFRMYAEHFKLLQHIRFQTSVKRVRQRPDFSRTGQWEVVTENKDGQEERHVFDAVICCSGHFNYPNLPLKDFPGIETFEGKYFHSWDYKGPEDMYGKRVVVIGIGNSGGDIAVEGSRVAEQVYLSTRSGAWVIRQVSDNGLPVDRFNTRFFHIMLKLLPMSFLNWLGEKKLNSMYDHAMYGLKPKHRFFSQIPVINDDLPFKILSGAVIVKPNLREIRGSTVVFDDGSTVENVDMIVFATGYNYDFPYLTNNAIYKSGHRVGLYKLVLPPNLEHPTLAIVGFIHSDGAIMPQAEMQARWVARVFKGHKKLPSNQAMIKAVEKDTKAIEKNYVVSKLTPIQVDFVEYMDSLAKDIGVQPSLLWLFLTDFPLFWRVFWGPVTAYQYRLMGPGKWNGARRAIFTQFDRMFQPLKTRQGRSPLCSSGDQMKISSVRGNIQGAHSCTGPAISFIDQIFGYFFRYTSNIMVRRVAVVGAGSAGLACIKTCVDEGLEPVCFESSDDIGGLWKFKETPEPQRSSIYRSLMANTSKEMMCFSDFPMPADYPNYMHNSQLLQYFRLYAELLDRKPLINDDLPGRILHGALVMKSNLKGFKDSCVVFDDGTVEENIDVVIFCTGYNGHFPFLHSALSEGPHGELMLYKRLFPPSLQRYTLAIMGLFQTRGPIMPIVEMQARYPCPRQAALQVAYIPYLDFMAKEVGVRPNFLTLLLRDPVLWAKVFFGPCTPYQYRLTGPGQWAGARHAILTQWERVAQPFRTRVVPETKTVPSVLFSSWLLTFGGTLAIAGIALLLTKSEIIPGLQGVAQIVDKSKVKYVQDVDRDKEQHQKDKKEQTQYAMS
ncbi:Dimethylaniline monooxygenase [N-oxide-forming] 5 [Channa argus]|uniref:Flavin-containing monooxygenase n=1 Tax=Channa argus TaxID=215402 RepID=A0A6G1PLK9_CHAAH|nr:Dimethylaniline monooxygenase [N-oxide-forming] 5 [Channa argus]